MPGHGCARELMKLPRAVALMSLAPALALAAFDYPATKTVDHTDDYFGTKVADPFRWLEDVDSADTKAWVVGENKVTFEFLSKLVQRDAIKQRLTELVNYPRFSLPSKE